jgi:DsbC/DsbD-like thiol-disulfide interchange protein
MKQLRFPFLSIFGLFLLLGIGSDSAAQTVSGSIGNGTIARGVSTQGRVTLTIPGGLHVNSNRPNSKYSIPTTVRLEATGVTVGGVTYPPGRNKRFQFSDEAINIYEGRVTFPFRVTVPRNFRGNTIRVRAIVRFQACTDEVCYPPRNQEVTLTARVR